MALFLMDPLQTLKDGHCIYWPDSHKIFIERNVIFNTVKEPSLAPILPDESQDKFIDKERRQ